MMLSLGKESHLLNKQEDQLIKSAKVEMSEVKEENERLKLVLSQITKDYQSLQMRLNGTNVKPEETKKSEDTSPKHQQDEEAEVLVALSLGRASSNPPKRNEKKINCSTNIGIGREQNDSFDDEGLALGLGCRFDRGPTEVLPKNPISPENSFEEFKEDEEANERMSPSKSSITKRSGDNDDILQHNTSKKARVSIRAVCDTPTMNDGCQWRKYGQKISKGNPCPRAYYRCTISPSCPVRKQVQRCSEDMSILMTTYEGTHSHPLPLSATAMASTTSAAAAMLTSASSTSQPGLGASTSAASTITSNLHAMNFSLTNTPRPQPFHFPNSTISTTQSHPTITLDLTAPPTNSHLNRFTSTYVNFSSPSSSSAESNNLPWANGYHRGLDNIDSSNYGRRPPQESYQSYMLKNNQSAQIASATKAITSNPAFRSALAAAITSFVSNNTGNGL